MDGLNSPEWMEICPMRVLKDSELAKLRRQLNETSITLSQLESELAERDEVIISRDVTIQSLQKKIAFLKQAKEDVVNDFDALNATRISEMERLEKNLKELSSVGTRLQNLETEHQKVLEENRDLALQLEIMEIEKSKRKGLQGFVRDLERRIQELQHQVQHQVQEVEQLSAALQQSYSHLREVTEIYEGKIKVLEEDLHQRGDVSIGENMKDAVVDKCLQEMQLRCEQLTRDHELKMEECTRETENLRNDLEVFENKCKEAASQIEDRQLANKHLREEIDKLCTCNKDLESKLFVSEDLRIKLAEELQKVKSESGNAIQQLQARVFFLEEELAEASSQRDTALLSLQAAVDAADDAARSSLAMHNEEMEAAHKEIAELQEELQFSIQSNVEIEESWLKKMSILTLERDKMTKQAEELQLHVEALQADKTCILNTLEEKKCQILDIQGQMNLLFKDLEARESEKDDIKLELEVTLQKLIVQGEVLSSVERNAEEERNQREGLEINLQQLGCAKREIEETSAKEILSLKSEKEEMVREVEELKQKIMELQELHKQIAELQEELQLSIQSNVEIEESWLKKMSALTLDSDKMTKQVEELQLQVEALQADKSSVLNTLEEKKCQILDIQGQMNLLSKDLKARESEKDDLKVELEATVQKLIVQDEVLSSVKRNAEGERNQREGLEIHLQQLGCAKREIEDTLAQEILSLKSEKEEMAREVEESKQKIVELQEFHKQIAGLQEELQVSIQSNVEIEESWLKKMSTVTLENDKMTKQVEELQLQVEALQADKISILDTLEEKKCEILDIQGQMNLLSKDLKTQESEKDDLKVELEVALQKLIVQDEVFSSVKRNAEGERSQRQGLEINLQQLGCAKREIEETLAKEILSLKLEKEEMVREVEELKLKIMELQEEMNQLPSMEDFLEMKLRCNEATLNAIDLDIKVKGLESVRECNSARCKDLEQALETLESEVVTMKDKSGKQELQNEILRSELTALMAEKEKLEDRILMMRRELDSLRNENNGHQDSPASKISPDPNIQVAKKVPNSGVMEFFVNEITLWKEKYEMANKMAVALSEEKCAIEEFHKGQAEQIAKYHLYVEEKHKKLVEVISQLKLERQNLVHLTQKHDSAERENAILIEKCREQEMTCQRIANHNRTLVAQLDLASRKLLESQSSLADNPRVSRPSLLSSRRASSRDSVISDSALLHQNSNVRRSSTASLRSLGTFVANSVDKSRNHVSNEDSIFRVPSPVPTSDWMHSSSNSTFDANFPTGFPSSSLRPVPAGTGNYFLCEDEEGEFLNHSYLYDLKHGHCTIPDSKQGRVNELQRRNTLCLPHLKTSYPVETQTHSLRSFADEDLKAGRAIEDRLFKDMASSLNRPMRSESPPKPKTNPTCSTPTKIKTAFNPSYQKPGPPTPGKCVSGLANVGGSTTTGIIKTPSSLKRLLSRKIGTPRGRSKLEQSENLTPTRPEHSQAKKNLTFTIGFSPKTATGAFRTFGKKKLRIFRRPNGPKNEAEVF